MPFAYLNARSGGVSIKIFAGLMIGITFYTLNNLFSFLGVLNTWPPILVAVIPSILMLIIASIGLWFVERR
jgi:lipopolysaccharide export system permease protein